MRIKTLCVCKSIPGGMLEGWRGGPHLHNLGFWIYKASHKYVYVWHWHALPSNKCTRLKHSVYTHLFFKPVRVCWVGCGCCPLQKRRCYIPLADILSKCRMDVMRCKMSQHTSSRKAYTSTSLKKWLSIDKSYLEGVACLFIHRCCLYCLASSEALIKSSLRMQSTSPTKVWFHYASFWRGLTLLANRITTVSNAAPVSMFMAAVGWAEPAAMQFPCCGLTLSAKRFRLVGSTIRSNKIPCSIWLEVLPSTLLAGVAR